MARSATIVSLVALLLAPLVQSCSGESGDSCRKQSDCSSSLICCAAGAATTAGQRGVCQNGCTSVVIDAGATDSGTADADVDASAVDSGVDSGVDSSVDSGTDAGADAEVDAAP